MDTTIILLLSMKTVVLGTAAAVEMTLVATSQFSEHSKY